MLKFYKFSGIGNDFVLLDFINQKYQKVNVKKLCNRNFGVGADGILILQKSENCDARLQIFNSDASVAKMCGNALRCVAFYLYTVNKKKNQKIQINDKAYNCEILEHKNFGAKVKVSFDEVKILKQQKIEDMYGYIVDVKNLHFVTIVKNFNFDMQKKFDEITQCFTDGINVEFVKFENDNTIKVKVFERGVGKTLACGSGAVACAYVYNKLTNYKNVNVVLDGGMLNVKIYEKIYMTGNCNLVFCGEVYD